MRKGEEQGWLLQLKKKKKQTNKEKLGSDIPEFRKSKFW